MSAISGFLFDLFTCGLLTATIVYCVRLNKRIRILQDSRTELAELIAQFDQSTDRATRSIVEIQNASRKISENMDAKLQKANYLADDLAFLIERGGKLADQLSVGAPPKKPAMETAAAAATQAAARQTKATLPNTAPARPAAAAQPAAAAKPSLAAALGARLSPAAKSASAPPATVSRPRSRTEQELLEALKGGRG